MLQKIVITIEIILFIGVIFYCFDKISDTSYNIGYQKGYDKGYDQYQLDEYVPDSIIFIDSVHDNIPHKRKDPSLQQKIFG
jgi:hypothetical protein